MTLGQFTGSQLLVPQLECATKETALLELSKRLADADHVDNADAFLRAVLDYDALAPAVFDGVAVALARGTFGSSVGVNVEIASVADAPKVTALFGEVGGIVIVTCAQGLVERVEEIVFSYEDLNVSKIGETTNGTFRVKVADNVAAERAGAVIECSVSDLRSVYSTALETKLAPEEVVA